MHKVILQEEINSEKSIIINKRKTSSKQIEKLLHSELLLLLLNSIKSFMKVNRRYRKIVFKALELKARKKY